MLMVGVLDGLCVVDLATTQVGAPVSQLLADFGADVVMIEPPGGSPTRQIAGYPFWARGKRSVELDLRSEDGRLRLREMLRTADVFVETLRPGSLEGMGMSAQ